MRKTVLLCMVVILAASSLCLASDWPKPELFGGYSYYRADLNESETGVSPLNTNGWNAALTVPLNTYLGFTADFSGHYKTQNLSSIIGTAKGTLNEYNFLFGPTFSAHSFSNRMTPFVHALFGASYLKATGSIDTSLGSGSGSDTNTSFAMAIGGGLDAKVGKRLALRLGQFDWVRTQHYDLKQNNLRFSTGVVVKF
jgi:opacity protein-like surface antigen